MVVLKYISKTLCVWKFGWTDGWLADAKEWWTVDISASINLNEKIMQTEMGRNSITLYYYCRGRISS